MKYLHPAVVLLSIIALVVILMGSVSPVFSSDCVLGLPCENAVIGVPRQIPNPKMFLATGDDCPSSFEERVILLINVERANAGVPPLSLDIRLQAAARWMSDDMASEDDIPPDLVGSDGSTTADRIAREGYTSTAESENIAGGFATPDSLVAAWMGAPGIYRDNILNPSFEHLGVGYSYLDQPIWDHYWSVTFGATDGSRDPPLTSCDPGFYRMPFPIVKK
jgi:hypothetical protein